MNNPSEMVIYQSDDGRIRLETRLQNETLWMTQSQMAELFQTTQQNISLHIQNIYEEGELNADATHKKSLWDRITKFDLTTIKDYLIVALMAAP